MALKKKKFKPKVDKVNTTQEKEKENTKQVSIDLFANKKTEKAKDLIQYPPVPPNLNSKDDIFEYNKKGDFMGQLEKDLISPGANFDGAAENNELSEIMNSKHSQGELLINEFLDDDDDEEIDFFTKNTGKKHKNGVDQNLKSSSRSKSSQKTNGDKTKTDTRDINFLMQRYKEDNNGVGTTDICNLFSYWQINFDPDRAQKSLIHENQTLINYNSKSFNNKTYFNQNRPMSLDRSPLEENFNLDQMEQNSIEGELKPSEQNYKKDQKLLVPKINFGKHKSDKPSTGQREQSDPRQVDSILFSQKMQQEPNDIQLGNVKNQMFFNQHNQSKRNSQNSIQQYPKGSSYGREIDRNQLSVEIMNITPIMEEKGEFQQIDHVAVKNFEIKESIENIKEEQFSFDQDLNFHPQGKNEDTNEFDEIEERFSINYLNTCSKKGTLKSVGNIFFRQKQISQHARKFAQIKQSFPIYYKKITSYQVMFGQTASLQLVRVCQNIPLIFDLGRNLDERFQLNLDQLSPIKGENQKSVMNATYLTKILRLSPFKYFSKILNSQTKLNLTRRLQFVHLLIYQFGKSQLKSQIILGTVSDKWMERNVTGPKRIFKERNTMKVTKFPDNQSPVEAAFDCLSSIDSADNNDDVDEGEVLEVLQSNVSNVKGNVAEKQLKNDDLQYQQIKEKNLNKYRDKSQTSDIGMQKYVSLGSRTRGDGSRTKEKSSKRNHMSDTKKDKKKRKRSKYGGESSKSKSKSKSRFSNNLGLTQANKDTDLNDGDDIQKLIEEIDNDKNELDQFISQEEEKYTKKFEHITSEAERKLQNSHRDGSNNRGQDTDRALQLLFNNGGREQSQTQRLDLGLQNQHHNSISNHSGSFYFNLSKKVNLGATKSNNVSIEQNQHPYNTGVNYNNRSGMQNQRDGSVGMFINDNRGASGFNMNQSSSSSSSNSSSQQSSNGQTKFKNISHQIYNQTSQLLTDRPNIGKKLDLGRVRGSINKNNSKINAAQGDKSNERGVSIISGNSNHGGLNKSYQNKQRFLFSNQMDGNNQQYSSLSRVGIKKISSGYSNGGLSNQSPSNKQMTQFQSNQKLAAFANNSNVNNSKHSNGGSAVKNRTSNHNVSGFMTNTQNSYRTLNFAGQNQSNQNPILLKLQSTQISRGAANANATQIGGSNSILLQTQELNLNNPALSQRNHTSSIQSIITPKSIGLKGPSQINFQGGNHLNSKTSAYTQQKSGQVQPIIRNINLEESNKKDLIYQNQLQNMSSENSPLFKQGSKEQSSPSEVNALYGGMNEMDINEATQSNSGGNQKQILSIKMLKTKSIKNIDTGPNMGSQSTRVPVIGKFGASVSIANSSSNQNSSSNLKMKSFRGAKGQNKNTTISNNTNLNISQSKLSEQRGNSSVSSEFNQVGSMSQRKMKLRVKPRNFMNNTQKNLQKPQNQTETLETDPDWNINNSKILKDQSIQQSNVKSPTKRDQRRDRNSRGLRSSITSQNTLTAQKQRTSQVVNLSPSHASGLKIAVKPQMKNIVSQFDEEQDPQQLPSEKRESKLKQPSQYQKIGAYSKSRDKKQMSETQFNSQLQNTKDMSNLDQVQQQYQIHQQPIQQSRAYQNTSLEVHDQDRLIALLINEFKRKKGKNIKTDIQPQDQVSTLFSFWKESLCSSRIKHKLTMKLHQSYSHANNNKSQSISSKLSDKEKWLLAYLEGTDKTQLMKLGKDSTTRNYGELACIDEQILLQEMSRYLGIQVPTPSESTQTLQSESQSKRQNFEGGSQSISNASASNNEKPIVFQFFINNN